MCCSGSSDTRWDLPALKDDPSAVLRASPYLPLLSSENLTLLGSEEIRLLCSALLLIPKSHHVALPDPHSSDLECTPSSPDLLTHSAGWETALTTSTLVPSS